MKKSNIFLTLSLVLLVVVSITSSTFVFADELQPNAILNFNQLLDLNYRSYPYTSGGLTISLNGNYLHINGSNSSTVWVAVSDIVNITNNSKLFVSSNYLYDDIKKTTSDSSYILTSSSTYHFYLRLLPGTYNEDIILNVINLSQMYGFGNEPNLDQCRNIFSTYYSYTPSYLLTLDNLESYQNGVASVLGSQTLELIPKVIFNNASSIDYYIDVSGNKQNISTFTKYSSPISYDFTGYLKFDLLTTLKAGTEITISDINSLKYGSSYYPSFGYMYNSTYIELQPYNSYNGAVSFVIPVDINNITFANLDLYTTTLNSFTISYKTNDINLILYNMYQEGVNSVDTDYYYKLGYYDGQQVDVIDDGLSVMGKIFAGVGNMLNIHVYQGITIGTLLLIPLLFMVLFFVLKLARG